MFDIQTKKEGVNIKIYRDARPVALLWLFFGLFFAIPALTIKDKMEMLAVFSIVTAGNILGCVVFWYVLHGAIVLNKTRRQVEFLKDLGLQTPGAAYRVDEIAQVTLKSVIGTGEWGPYTAWKIVLKVKNAQESELGLFFSSKVACVQAVKTIAEFAQVPAYDFNGKPVFTPPR